MADPAIPLVDSAALNNAQWCAAMWASHGLHVEEAPGLVLTRSRPPPFYPNAVTTSSLACSDLVSYLAALARRTSHLTVKDSFAALDLEAFGFRPLLDARWVWRRWEKDAGSSLIWRRVQSPEDLEQWEESWRGKAGGPLRLFRPALLDRPDVAILGGFSEGGRIAAGGIAFASAGVLGVTNLFGQCEGFFSAAVRETGIPLIVRYETGSRLLAALDQGFEDAGPMRV